jgi:hypothetical protein
MKWVPARPVGAGALGGVGGSGQRVTLSQASLSGDVGHHRHLLHMYFVITA